MEPSPRPWARPREHAGLKSTSRRATTGPDCGCLHPGLFRLAPPRAETQVNLAPPIRDAEEERHGTRIASSPDSRDKHPGGRLPQAARREVRAFSSMWDASLCGMQSAAYPAAVTLSQAMSSQTTGPASDPRWGSGGLLFRRVGPRCRHICHRPPAPLRNLSTVGSPFDTRWRFYKPVVRARCAATRHLFGRRGESCAHCLSVVLRFRCSAPRTLPSVRNTTSSQSLKDHEGRAPRGWDKLLQTSSSEEQPREAGASGKDRARP
jgi:hypothetical protein